MLHMSLILHFEPPPHWQAMRVSLETRRLFSAAKKAERQQCGMAQAGQLSTAVPLCVRYLQISTACIQKSVSEITDGHGFACCSHLASSAWSSIKPLTCSTKASSLATRHQRRSTALITNIDFDDWADYMIDGPLVMAFLDRPVEGAVIIKIEGRFYRAGNRKLRRPLQSVKALRDLNRESRSYDSLNSSQPSRH